MNSEPIFVQKKTKAFLFDHDGVIAQSESLHMKAWKLYLQEIGIEWKPEYDFELVGKTAGQNLRWLLAQHPEWLDKVDPETVRTGTLRKNSIYLELARHELTAYPKAKELLQELRSRNISTAVVSNAQRKTLDFSIELNGLTSYLDFYISVQDGIPKPSPDLYLKAVEKLGLLPEEAIGVEDSSTGLQALHDAGIPAIAVLTTTPKKDLATWKPIAYVKDVEELFARIRFE